MKAVFALVLAASFPVNPLPQEDGPLEPSVQNEVDHAVGLAEAWLAGRAAAVPAATNALLRAEDLGLFPTNGLSREKIAIRLIASQKGEGWWATPTNDAPTRLAVNILKGL